MSNTNASKNQSSKQNDLKGKEEANGLDNEEEDDEDIDNFDGEDAFLSWSKLKNSNLCKS